MISLQRLEKVLENFSDSIHRISISYVKMIFFELLLNHGMHENFMLKSLITGCIIFEGMCIFHFFANFVHSKATNL